MATAMELESDDDILRKVASGGSMDYSSWPSLLPRLLSRIDKIAHEEFPVPSVPPPSAAPHPQEPRLLAPLPSSDPIETPAEGESSSQETNKENANPEPPSSSASGPASAPEPLEPGALPPQVVSMLAEINNTLTDGFSLYPPHTMQRLAELVLFPRQHYHNLPAYLHAVDRVVHVTSSLNVYPLPPAISDMSTMSLANGVTSRDGGSPWSGAAGATIGSDEALGGALLTPIPWLQRRTNGGDGTTSGSPSPASDGSDSSQGGQPQSAAGAQGQERSQGNGRQLEGQVRTESTETIEGPNGMGSIETVSVSVNGIPSTGAGPALTQGEIIRQEQRMGVVPVTQLARSNPTLTSTAGAVSSENAVLAAAGLSSSTPASAEGADEDGAPTEELPHARGPEEIGAADMGPQAATTSYVIGAGGGVEMHGIDVEAAVGRRADNMPPQTELLVHHHRHPHRQASRSPPEGTTTTSSGTPSTAAAATAVDTSTATSATLSAASSPAKREAEEEDVVGDEEEEAHRAKKLKEAEQEEEEEEGQPGAAGDDDSEQAARAEGGAEGEGDKAAAAVEKESELKKDAEGDIVLADGTPAPEGEEIVGDDAAREGDASTA